MATVSDTSVRYYAGLEGSSTPIDSAVAAFVINEAAFVTNYLGKTTDIDSAACTAAEKSAIEKLAASDCLMTLASGTDVYHLNRARELRQDAMAELNRIPGEWDHEVLGVTT
jgi:hypothetical protein